MTKNGKHCGKMRNCSFFFCHYVFKNPAAAEASESVYVRERVEMSIKMVKLENSANKIVKMYKQQWHERSCLQLPKKFILMLPNC